ncbi:iron ABC transporter permease [Paenibacillus sp.]|uniref:FecCD family ABC transporter permease n=1 Tax=Paenibacillus sp. TaxID=58172 RepID=UPI002811765B|nr:iron ABC transporter permease [Paenibacillus sp.]
MIHPQVIRKQRWLLGLLLALLLLVSVIGAGVGYSSLSFDRLLPTLLGSGTFKEEFVLFSVRLPRIAVTLLAGMALALSGAVLQGITRNELADPGIIGVNSGAGVAIATFYLFLPIDTRTFAWMLPLVAFLGAIVTALVIYALAYRRKSGLQPTSFVLMGVGVSLALSGAMVVIVSSAEREKVDFVSKWLAGSIWGADGPFIAAVAPWLALLIPFVLSRSNRLNLLGMSEPAAIGVGAAVQKERFVLLLAATALAATAVSVAGGVAFIGLMAPHIARSLVGPRHQLMLPLALAIGAFLLLSADTIGRNLADPDGIPAGIMVSLLGAPYFLYLLLRKSR